MFRNWTNTMFERAVIPMILGVVLWIAAVTLAVRQRHFVSTALVAGGVVTKLNAGGSHPEIAFIDASGRQITYPQGGLIVGYRPGDKVRVLYESVDPSNTATVDAVGAVWFDAIGLVFLGLIPMIIGTVALIERFVSRRKAAIGKGTEHEH